MGEIINYYEYLRGKVLALPNISDKVKEMAEQVDAYTFCVYMGLVYIEEENNEI